MSQRFPYNAASEFQAAGTRGPSAMRLTLSQQFLLSSSSLDRDSLSNSLSRHRNKYKKKDPPFGQKSAAELKAARGQLCYVCGTETVKSGNGLRTCPMCRSVQMQSGLASHLRSLDHPEDGADLQSRKASKQGDGNQSAAVEIEASGFVTRKAWSKLAQSAHAEMTHSLGTVQLENISGLHEERTPIMVGSAKTGFYKGDRVRTALRLAGACPGAGWDPINCATGGGTVLGPGRKTGEIMVKFDYNNVTCSMKASQLEHIHIHPPATNLERSRQRKSHSQPAL